MALRITLRQLEYFVAVSDCGSVTQAAQQVNVSAPSISAAIAQLEAEFGLQLFVRRHAQNLSLSEAGARFVEAARRTLEQAQGLSDLASDISGQVRGPLRVGCLLTFAQFVLPRLRRSFADLYPEVDFRQSERDQSDLFAGLRAAKLDVALTYDLNIPPDLVFRPLLDLPPYAVFAADHPLAGRPDVSARDLGPCPMVLLDLPLSAEYFLSFFAKAGVAPRIAERTRDMAVMQGLVANGFGYSMANFRPPSDLAPDGSPLRFVPLAGSLRSLKLGLLTAAGTDSVRTVRAFIDHAARRIPPVQEPLAGPASGRS